MLGYKALVAWMQQAGTAFNTYTTSKQVINPEATWTIPAGFLKNVGTKIKIDVWGSISNIVTTPGTITFEVKIGPTANIVCFTTGAIQLNATAHTLLPFHLEISLTLDSIGSGTTAKFRGQAEVKGVMFTKTAGQTDGANSETVIQVPVTAPAVGTGFDSTVANLFDFWAGFSISNAGNGIQIHQYEVSVDN